MSGEVRRLVLEKNDKRIVVDIDSDGNIVSETFGYVGASCVEDVEKIMKDLAKMTCDNIKPERWKQVIAGDKGVKVENKLRR